MTRISQDIVSESRRAVRICWHDICFNARRQSFRTLCRDVSEPSAKGRRAQKRDRPVEWSWAPRLNHRTVAFRTILFRECCEGIPAALVGFPSWSGCSPPAFGDHDLAFGAVRHAPPITWLHLKLQHLTKCHGPRRNARAVRMPMTKARKQTRTNVLVTLSMTHLRG